MKKRNAKLSKLLEAAGDSPYAIDIKRRLFPGMRVRMRSSYNLLRPGDEGARSSGRTVVYRLKKKPRRTFSEIFGAELLTGAEGR